MSKKLAALLVSLMSCSMLVACQDNPSITTSNNQDSQSSQTDLPTSSSEDSSESSSSIHQTSKQIIAEINNAYAEGKVVLPENETYSAKITAGSQISGKEVAYKDKVYNFSNTSNMTSNFYVEPSSESFGHVFGATSHVDNKINHQEIGQAEINENQTSDTIVEISDKAYASSKINDGKTEKVDLIYATYTFADLLEKIGMDKLGGYVLPPEIQINDSFLEFPETGNETFDTMIDLILTFFDYDVEAEKTTDETIVVTYTATPNPSLNSILSKLEGTMNVVLDQIYENQQPGEENADLPYLFFSKCKLALNEDIEEPLIVKETFSSTTYLPLSFDLEGDFSLLSADIELRKSPTPIRNQTDIDPNLGEVFTSIKGTLDEAKFNANLVVDYASTQYGTKMSEEIKNDILTNGEDNTAKFEDILDQIINGFKDFDFGELL